MRLLFWALYILMLSGCVNVATSTFDVATGVSESATNATARAAKTSISTVSNSRKESKRKKSDEEDPHPFNEISDPGLDIDAALAQASITGKNVLLVFGGNWCHDSRGLAAKFEMPDLAAIIKDNYELVWVDIGFQDRNMNMLQRFGVYRIYGTPVVIILSSNGEILNSETMHDWRAADSRSYQEAVDYFQSFAIDDHSGMS